MARYKRRFPIHSRHFPFLKFSPPLFLFSLGPANGKQILSAATLAAMQVRNIRVRRQSLCNVSASLNLTNLHQAVTRLGNGLANSVGTLGLTLCADDVGLTLLLGALDNEAGTLGILLGNLLLLDGLGELAAKGHVGNGHVLEGNVELGGAAGQLAADALGDGLSLGNEFGGIKLGDDGLEDFVSDGGEDSLIVVGAEVLLNKSVRDCDENKQ